MKWIEDQQINGMGWLSDCGNYAIRECVYRQDRSEFDENFRPYPTRAVEYFCYYRPIPNHKFMHLNDGVVPSLVEAKERCIDHSTAAAVTAIREIDSHIGDELKRMLA